MQRPLTAALPAALGLFLSLIPAAHGGEPSAAAEAQRRLDHDDLKGALGVLEAALPGAPAADRPALLKLLRQAYTAAALRAEADGRRDEAEAFRENLDILDRKPRAESPAPVKTPAPTPEAKSEREPVRLPSIPLPRAREKAEPVDPPAGTPPDSGPALEPPKVDPPAESAPVSPAPLPLPPGDRPKKPALPPPAAAGRPAPAAEGVSVQKADEAYLAERYVEAGKAYAALDRAGKLPADRRDHWAYCRAVDVVSRINNRPASAREWAAIDAEIQAISALSPSHWFPEYLRKLAAERTRAVRPRTSRAGKVVVRGSSPEEPAPPPAPVPASPPGVGPEGGASRVPWSRQPVATPNFVVRHVESHRALAEQVARAAEVARETQAKRWGPSVVPTSWDPRCEIVLFPTPQDFSRETMQPPDSPGFSTMGMNEGRIVLRRVHLRADHPNLVKAVLPHEVTHVVLADVFPEQQIPRWADEGLAVLAEPAGEQALRAADLDEPLKSGRLFRVSDLVVMDYPAQEHWALYYAQSVSLTRYLVETGSSARFIKFVRSAQKASQVHLLGKLGPAGPADNSQVRNHVQEAMRLGFADALKEVYGISGYDDLQARWQAYASNRSSSDASVAVSSPDRDKEPEESRR